MIRSPLQFDQLVGDRIDHVGEDMACVTSSNPDEAGIDIMTDTWTGTLNTAICSSQIMRAGKHYAKFRLTGCHRLFYVYPGVMRPFKGLDQFGLEEFAPWYTHFHPYVYQERTDRWGVDSESSVDCCQYYNFEGECIWCNWGTGEKHEVELDGMGTDIVDIEVGLLLDLDEGTLTVYKDGERLGVMKNVSH